MRAPTPLARVALPTLAILGLTAFLRHWPHLAPGAFNWAEPGNVAAALAGGRGFSDPFAGGTGPTAWVPPLPAWIEAAVFLLTGIRTHASALFLVVLSVAALCVAATALFRALEPDGRGGAWVGWAAFIAGCTLPPDGPLVILSEAPLALLLSALLLESLLGVWRLPAGTRPPRGRLILLAALSASCALAHAGLALAALCALALLLLLLRRDRARRPAPALALLCIAAALGAWTARNRAVLGRPVPLKSNLWFELHLANVAAPDGLPRSETVLREMPFFDRAQFARYACLGELRYVDGYRAPTLAALRADPLHFAGNVLRRAANALVYCRRDGGAQDTSTVFAPDDLRRLVEAGELMPLGGTSKALWMHIDAPAARQKAVLFGLGLSNPARAWADWCARRVDYDRAYLGAAGLLEGFAKAGLPLLALLGAALLTGGRLTPSTAWAALLALTWLLPFVLINHNERQQTPLLALQAAWVGGCAAAVALRRPAGSRP